ncbi:uncharacterized protein LOC131806593 [Musca domestica]|uniref:Uncharacterized protein LOC131806593 n=1 Tax=Musca domestica TaxID=7370 RepID=A0ABM3VM80_MUSDO|nr:uncharacterized protein LOC131806593 [Musca domestica]
MEKTEQTSEKRRYLRFKDFKRQSNGCLGWPTGRKTIIERMDGSIDRFIVGFVIKMVIWTANNSGSNNNNNRNSPLCYSNRKTTFPMKLLHLQPFAQHSLRFQQ